MIESIARALSKPFQNRIAVYNGVAVRDWPLFLSNDVEHDYKFGLLKSIQENVKSEDSVTIVGGGKGVAATHAARISADVTVYEAAREMVQTLYQTQRLNNVAFDVRHGVVGKAYDVYGTVGNAQSIAPERLSGDVLILDCEGAEMDILPETDFETVIVETHPNQGAPTNEVLELLDGGKIVAPDPIDGAVVVA